MPASPTMTPELDEATPPERNGVLLIVVGALVVLSVVIAGLVIFTSGDGAATKPEAPAPVTAGRQSLTVGRQSAQTKVVVYEDYASPQSRELEIASRDFLRIEAARGRVEVEYRPITIEADAYSRDAIMAWAGVLGIGTPRQALTFHDVLFDRQPDPGSDVRPQFATWAKDKGIHETKVLRAMDVPDPELLGAANRAAAADNVTTTPVVLVDGKRLTDRSPTGLADRLQRLLLRRD